MAVLDRSRPGREQCSAALTDSMQILSQRSRVASALFTFKTFA